MTIGVSRVVASAALCASFLLGASAIPAKAAYVLTFAEVGSDVVATGGGTIDLTDLRLQGAGFAGTPLVNGRFSVVVTGDGTSDTVVDEYAPFSGPDSFGENIRTFANSGSGDPVGVDDLEDLLVPFHYISGSSLTSTATWLNASFATLGLTPGTYVYSWGTGVHADTFTLDIPASPPAAPEPSTWAMMLLGFAGLGYAAVRRKGARRGPGVKSESAPLLLL